MLCSVHACGGREQFPWRCIWSESFLDSYQKAVRVDPLLSALLARAAELARRDSAPEIQLRHALRGLLMRPVTPALEQHLYRAAAIADDANSSAISDLHFLLAIAEDDVNLATQILSQRLEVSALIQELRSQVEAFNETEA